MTVFEISAKNRIRFNAKFNHFRPLKPIRFYYVLVDFLYLYIMMQGRENHTMSREEFIDQHAELFWYIPESGKKQISDEVLVESVFRKASTLMYLPNRKRASCLWLPILAKDFI